MNRRRDPIARFMSFVIKDESDCWLWKGNKDRKGYAKFWYEEKTERAARVSYVLFIGPIPDDLTIDHKCRIVGCVNPNHLEVVTRAENLYRSNNYIGINRRKTHCKRNHEFSKENTRLLESWKGIERRCIACEREKYQEKKASSGRV